MPGIRAYTNQYKICMSLKSSEFYMRYLIIAHRKMDKSKHFSQVLERAMLKRIDMQVEDSYSKEWLFTPDISVLEKRMGEVLQAHPDFYTMALKFLPSGIRVFSRDGRGFNTKPITFKQLINLNPDVNNLLLLSRSTEKPKKRRLKDIIFGVNKYNKDFIKT